MSGMRYGLDRGYLSGKRYGLEWLEQFAQCMEQVVQVLACKLIAEPKQSKKG